MTDGVRYSDFSPLPADQLAGDEKFVGLKDGVNVRLEGDWRGPLANLLRLPMMGVDDVDADGYNNVSFLSSGGTGTLTADRNNATFLGNNGAVTIVLDAAAGRVEANELMIGGDLILFPKNNLTATSNPGAANDNTQGYSALSKWLNTSTGEVWICVSAATGAAEWSQTTVDADDLGNLAFENGSTAGLNLVSVATPGEASWARINSDGTVSLLTTAQLSAAVGGGGGGGAQLDEANTWTALQTFGAGFVSSASGIISGTGAINRLVLERTGGAVDDGHALLLKNSNGGSRIEFNNEASSETWRLGTENISDDFLVTLLASGSVEFRIKGNGDIQLGRNGAGIGLLESGGTVRTITAEKVAAWDSAGGGTNTATEQTFTSADQDGSSNIAVALDASQNTEWQLNFNGSPLPNTSGAFNINLHSLPDSIDNLAVYYLRIKRGGRKTLNLTAENESASSISISFIEPPVYRSTVGGWDIVSLQRWPGNPNTLYASLIDGR